MGQILPRPTAEAAGWLQTGHHLPVSFQLPALFILLRSHHLPSGINRVAVLHSHTIKMPRPPGKRRSFIPWASSFHALPPICCMLRVQAANDQAPHGDPGHSILISLSEGWFMGHKCTYSTKFLFLFYNTVPLLWASFFSVRFKLSFFFGFSAKVILVTVAVFRCQLFRLYIFLGRLWPDLSEVMEDDTFPDTLLSQLVHRCGTGEDSGRLDDTWGPQTGVNLQCIHIRSFYFFFAEVVVGLLSSPLSTGSHCHSVTNWFSTRMRNHVTASWPGSSSRHCFIGVKLFHKLNSEALVSKKDTRVVSIASLMRKLH